MREIRIGSQTVRVRATPLALLYYKQEFKTDMMGDLMKMKNIVDDPTQIDILVFLQLIWAMAKADAFGKQFPSFVEWMSSLESFDFSDRSLLTAVMEEAAQGFFRSGAKAGARHERPGGNRTHRNRSSGRR